MSQLSVRCRVSTGTMQLYDRRHDELNLDEVERVVF